MKSIESIVTAGVRFYDLERSELLGRCRTETVSLVRFSVMWACREEGHSFQTIGDAFNRDHGTVMHAIRNTNKEKFGGFWPDHANFIIRLKNPSSDDSIEDLKKAARIGLEKQIEEISGTIGILRRCKEKLIESLSELTPLYPHISNLSNQTQPYAQTNERD